jgi:protein Mpv17
MALSKLNAFFKQRPLFVSLIGNTIKTATADAVTQKYIEKKDDLDIRRLAVFTSFGFAYLGGWQYFLFNKLFVRSEKFMTVAKLKPFTQSSILTFLDLGVHTPLMYYPCFYSIKSHLEGKTFKETLSTYKTNIHQDMLAMWKIWIPAQMANFTFVPLHMRMPFIASVSFGWTIILSMTRGGSQQ